MKKIKRFGTLLIILLVILFSVNSVAAGEENKTKERYIVKLKSVQQNISFMASGVEKIKELKYTKNAMVVMADKKQIEDLKNSSYVEYVEEDFKVEALVQTVPWGIQRINAPQVWNYGNTGQGIKVAVIDTGIDYTHPDLGGCLGSGCKVAGGYDFVNGDANPMDDNGHGTHVAGTIAATDNVIGVIGVAPNVSLYAVKVLDSTGSGWYSDVTEGINWATSNGMQVISMSLGGPDNDYSMEQAVNNAYNAGVVLVAAAGNDGPGADTVLYPAKFNSVIAVAAIDSNNNRASFSSTGPAVELAAPGVFVYSTVPTGTCALCDPSGYRYLQGTSMATPHVSGTVALLLNSPIPASYDTNNNGKWDPPEVRKRLQDTATDLGAAGKDNEYGYGLVDALAAVSAASQPLYVSITESPDPVTSANPSQVTVHVTATGGTNISNASVSISATGGSLSPTTGTTDANGDFKPTYTAPAVTVNTTYTISATASKAGYTSGSGSDPILVIIGLPLYVSITGSSDPVISGNTSLATVHVTTTGGTNVSNASVSISATGGSLSPINGTTDANGNFNSTYTPPAVTTTTTYTISATASKAGYTSGSGSDLITVNPSAQGVIFYDDIESGTNNWISSGLWHITTRRYYSPTHAWWYGQESTGNYDTGAANSGYLTSPSISLPGASSPKLYFMSWYKTEVGTTYDKKIVQISTDGGSTWATLKQISDTQSQWNLETIDLTIYAGGPIKIRFYFNTVDNFANYYEGWYIDDVKIEGAVAAPDTTPPAAITDLAASNPATNSIKLTWTSPGDDGNTGTASQYDIRYSISPITDGNWTLATQVTGEPAPAAAGTVQTFTVLMLSPGTTYYFAIKTADEIPNWSNLSNAASGATLADTTPPAVSVSGAPAAWQNTDATASVACSDSQSGCNASSYRLKTHASNPGTCPVDYAQYTLPSPTAISSYAWVCGAAKDNTGNEGFSSPVEFKIDKNAPSINAVHSPLSPNTTDTVNITASATDDNSLSEIKIYVNGSLGKTCSVTGASASCIYASTYSAGMYNYYATARDIAGNMKISSTGQFTVNITHTTGIIFYDNIESGTNNWINSSLWHITSRRSNSSTHAWWYGQESTGNYDTGAANSGYLTSPSISLAGASTPTLSFMSWYRTESSGTAYDKKIVQISTDGGSTWATLKQISDTQSQWNLEAIDLTSYAGKTIKIRFYFNTVDKYANNYEGWYIDDVKIE